MGEEGQSLTHKLKLHFNKQSICFTAFGHFCDSGSKLPISVSSLLCAQQPPAVRTRPGHSLPVSPTAETVHRATSLGTEEAGPCPHVGLPACQSSLQVTLSHPSHRTIKPKVLLCDRHLCKHRPGVCVSTHMEGRNCSLARNSKVSGK